MSYLLFLVLPLLAAVKVSLQGYLSKEKVRGISDVFLLNAMVFTSLVVVMGALFLRAFPSSTVLLLSFAEAVVCVLFQVCYTLAFRSGSVGLATVINNFNIAFPLLFGVVCYSERISVPNLAGLAFLAAAFILIPSRGSGQTNLRWFIFAFAAFFSSGISNCIMLYFSRTFSPEQRTVFIIFGYAWAAFFCFALFVLTRKGSCTLHPDQRMACSVILIGILIGAYNLLTMQALSIFDSVVLYPVVNVATMAAVAAADYILYRKPLYRRQIAGFIAGVICVVLLNI